MVEQLKNILEQEVRAGTVAGASLLVFQKGAELAYAEAGYADKEKHISYSRNTIARLYSATKPITAAAAMLLMERGQLDLFAPVANYLPAFANQMVAKDGLLVPPTQPMTVKDLLCMTSGLVYGGRPGSAAACGADKVFGPLEEPGGETLKHITTRMVAEQIASGPLEFSPGDRWMYGSSADVLGAIIEIVAGMRFGKFLHKEFFEPLNMVDTAFYVPADKQERLATMYQQSPNGLVPYDINRLGISNTMKTPPTFESAGAGLASTLDDYCRFAQMLLNKGLGPHKRILSERTVEYMTTGRLLPQQQTDMWLALSGYTYGNLMRVLQEPGQAMALGTKGEYGWDGWAGFYFANSPADQLTMLLSFQLANSGTIPMTRRLRNVIWSGLAQTW